jgi:crotonobetainyl-CoA:carnitine CoA-transferase CaiB-like acyl-CoA transferase
MADLPLSGIRVIELATWGFVPSAATILADWGADVLKIEHAQHGDPIRSLSVAGRSRTPAGVNFMWELHNRGKRGLAIDLATPGGAKVMQDLLKTTDVFLTNFLPGARQRFHVDVDEVRALNPGIIYGRGSGMGPLGPEAARGGYDAAAFWARAGIARKVTTPESTVPPGLPAAAFGDVLSGLALAGGIAAAVAGKARHGNGAVIDTSLLAAGMWAMRNEIVGCLEFGIEEHFRNDRGHLPNPINAMYRTSDGRFIQLVMLEADKHWPDLCRRIGRLDLLDDPRFATMDLRTENTDACVDELERTFARHPLAYWTDALSEATGVWAVAQDPSELAVDPQAVANGYIRHIMDGNGQALLSVPNPVQIDGAPGDAGPAPEWGQHTDEVLLELGYTWDEVVALKLDGAIL